MESEDFYYESSVSKTRFQALEPDPEELGMQDFRRAEEVAVLNFLESRDQVLVMGGG